MNGNAIIHQCLFCEKSFSSVLKLESHYNVHTKERPYFCTYCDDSFSSNNVRWVHEKIHLGTPQYKCDLCEKMFTSPSTLYSHRKRDHKGMGPGGANNTGTGKGAKQQKFSKNKNVTARKPKKKKFISKSKSTTNDNDLNLSGLTKTNPKEETKTTPTDNQQIIPITVTEFYSAANPATINNPVSTFNNNYNEVTPNLSDNQAKMSTARAKDESQQHEQNSFSCNSCSKTFATGSALNLHVMRKHGSREERRYRCEPCDKAYCTMAELNRHNVRIHKDKFVNFSQSVTSSSISSSTPPKNGKLSTATGKKGVKISKKKNSSGGGNQKIAENSPNACQFCHESFNSQRRLKLHMTVEHGQKTVNSYKCEQCQKGFYSADQLKSHVCIYQRPKQWNNGFQSQSPDANIIKIQNVTMGSVLDRQLLHMICE